MFVSSAAVATSNGVVLDKRVKNETVGCGLIGRPWFSSEKVADGCQALVFVTSQT